MTYSELTRRYFEAAPHCGVLLVEETGPDAGRGAAAEGTPRVFRGSAGDRERGTWVQFDVRVAARRCLDARFLAFGCPHTIAAAAWVAEQASGSALRAALPEPAAALAQRFAAPVEKLGRLLIVEDAWRAAVAPALSLQGADPIQSLGEADLKEL